VSGPLLSTHRQGFAQYKQAPAYRQGWPGMAAEHSILSSRLYGVHAGRAADLRPEPTHTAPRKEASPAVRWARLLHSFLEARMTYV